MAAINSVTSLTLNLPPSCIAFTLTQSHFFVVGSYQLHPNSGQQDALSEDANLAHDTPEAENAREDGVQKRSGSLILYKLEGDSVYV